MTVEKIKGKMNGKALDGILEWLRDSQWHYLDEIKGDIPLPRNTIDGVIRLLNEISFIEFDEENYKARIKPLGLEFLELPCDPQNARC
ncbi:MAG: hypothetical protein EFT35_00290 [Methanophagales archaeon ANME-1-THS]|nr:MAG: hypothetical protein EFT35_00290 [Methanophagales archaeon ANME-1-THS]